MARSFWLIVAMSLISHASSVEAQERYVDVWFRSFIDIKHPGIPDYISKAANGRYVIRAPDLPAPTFMDVARFKGTCFTTDQRTFTSELDSSARVGVYLRIVVIGRELKVDKIGSKPNVIIGETHNVDCRSGADLRAPMTADISSVSISDIKVGQFYRNFSVKIAASDPFYSILGVKLAPKIDSEILFSYNVSTRQLKITGSTEPFPSFEGYYKKSNGPVVKILNRPPDSDATALSLIDIYLRLNLQNFEDTIDLLDWN